MIELELKRIADALEVIAGRMNGGNVPSFAGGQIAVDPMPTAEKPKKKGKVETAPTPTKDDITDILRQVVQTKGADKAKAILQKYKADRISTLKESDYAAVYNDMKEAIGG